jgi:hypothetical protein
MDLNKCKKVKENIYYIQKEIISQGKKRGQYEFLVLVQNGVKCGIILRCGFGDLHWYVFKKHRGQGVLSNALRTGIINEVWPENKVVTCSYDYEMDYDLKCSMTQHLAKLANLEFKDGESGIF